MLNNDMRKSVPIDPTARMLFEALEQVGWSVEDPSALARKIKQLDLGLPEEDEFAAIISWMGKCELVHKLDQEQGPLESKHQYQVPDLLVLFRREKYSVPILIEVKASNKPILSWKPDYLDCLTRYAAKLNLPLLVAWKYRPWGLWALFEMKHFTRSRQNYKISFGLAFKESLMGILAGDFAVVLKAGVGLHFRMKKERKLVPPNSKETNTENWVVRIEDAYFLNGEGQRIDTLGSGLWALFISAPLEEETKIDKSELRYSFFIGAEMQGLFAQKVFPTMLEFQSKTKTLPRWRIVLRENLVPINFQTLSEAATEGISVGVVQYVLNPVPHTKPEFLVRI